MQKDVDTVVDIMRDNVEKTFKRGENLQNLEQVTISLEGQAKQFEVTAVKLKKQQWWNNMKMKLIIGGIVALIIIIIIGK